MVRAEIFRKYFCELNQCTQYELKYKKYDKTDRRYEKYRQQYLFHKRMASHYYEQIKDEEDDKDLEGEALMKFI